MDRAGVLSTSPTGGAYNLSSVNSHVRAREGGIARGILLVQQRGNLERSRGGLTPGNTDSSVKHTAAWHDTVTAGETR